ncbi:MAG: 3'-5' exonuclease [Polyangiaceae bacterium]|nr:3'-5' exonuclease [Polyangiaceae bacterium]
MPRWLDQSLLVLDVETTGLDPRAHRIVEIALVAIERGNILPGIAWLTNPGSPIPPEATEIHGIGDDDVASADPFHALASTLAEAMSGAIPVAYNAPFDRGFIGAEWLRADPYGLMPAALHPASRWLDPLVWIRERDRYVKGEGRHRLSVTCARRGVEHGDAHRAKGDALACARLLVKLGTEGKIPADLDEALSQQYALAKEQEARHRAWVESRANGASL